MENFWILSFAKAPEESIFNSQIFCIIQI